MLKLGTAPWWPPPCLQGSGRSEATTSLLGFPPGSEAVLRVARSPGSARPRRDAGAGDLSFARFAEALASQLLPPGLTGSSQGVPARAVAPWGNALASRV